MPVSFQLKWLFHFNSEMATNVGRKSRQRTHGGHTAHLWVRDRHTHAASAGLRGVGAFAGGEAHLNVTRFKQQRSDSPATAYL